MTRDGDVEVVQGAAVALEPMNSRMSGWSQREDRHVGAAAPPALLDDVSVAASKTRMNETGPDATPPVERTTSLPRPQPLNEKPVPPPDWWMSAMSFRASKISTIESSTGSTKHAASWPIGVPAFMSVGEFGRNSSVVMTR